MLIGGLTLGVLALLFFLSTSVEEPPGLGPVGPTTDAVPDNAEPSRLQAPPTDTK